MCTATIEQVCAITQSIARVTVQLSTRLRQLWAGSRLSLFFGLAIQQVLRTQKQVSEALHSQSKLWVLLIPAHPVPRSSCLQDYANLELPLRNYSIYRPHHSPAVCKTTATACKISIKLAWWSSFLQDYGNHRTSVRDFSIYRLHHSQWLQARSRLSLFDGPAVYKTDGNHRTSSNSSQRTWAIGFIQSRK